jgi:hypothetical protein
MRSRDKPPRSTRRVGDDPSEIEALETAILAKLNNASVLRPADTDFVHYRFANQLRNYWNWNGFYGFAFIVVTVGVVVASLASTSIAAGWGDQQWGRGAILALGILGAAAGIVNWSWKPGQKAVSRTRGLNSLRAEGWAFVEDRGHYKNVPDVREAFGLFVDEVAAIASAAAAIDESEPQGPPPSAPT